MPEIGDTGFVPTLGMPNFDAMQGPSFKKGSLGEQLAEKGLIGVFNKDILEDAKAGASPSLQALYNLLVFQLDTLNMVKPDTPVLPIEGVGKGGQIQINIALDAAAEGGDPVMQGWFKPNLVIHLTVNMVNLAKRLMEMEQVELAATMKSIMMVIELARSVADSIRSAGEAQAQVYDLQKMQGILQACMGIAQMGLGVASIINIAKFGTSGFLSQFQRGGGITSISSIGNGVGQAVTGFTSANLIMKKAHFEATKDLEETLRDFFEQNLGSSEKARDDLKDMIKKALDQLAELTTELMRAAGRLQQ